MIPVELIPALLAIGTGLGAYSKAREVDKAHKETKAEFAVCKEEASKQAADCNREELRLSGEVIRLTGENGELQREISEFRGSLTTLTTLLERRLFPRT